MSRKKTTRSKLPPLDFTDDVTRYEARQEKEDINFNKCNHSNVKFQRGMLICPCGASWDGPRLNELFDLLTRKI